MPTLWFVEEILDFAQQNATLIRQPVDDADRASVVGESLALRAEVSRGADVSILMGEVDEVRHPYSGAIINVRRNVSIPTPMADYGTFQPTEAAERFVIDSTSVASREFQGHKERTVWGHWVHETTAFPAGTAFVSVDQPLGRSELFQVVEDVHLARV